MAEQVDRMLPLYQGMMTTFYDHRAADVIRSATALKRQNQPRYLTDQEKADPERLAMPQYWIPEHILGAPDPWLLAFSDVTSATNERSLIPCALPAVGVNHKLPLISSSGGGFGRAALLCMLSSFIVDYLVRQKLGGTSMTYFYVKQLAILSPVKLEVAPRWDSRVSAIRWMVARVRMLGYTAVDMEVFARDLEARPEPYEWDLRRRGQARAELDAACFHLYEMNRDDVDYIMETFPIVKRKDIAAHGSFRTKEMILEVFDAMQAAADSGEPYVSPLEADGVLASGAE